MTLHLSSNHFTFFSLRSCQSHCHLPYHAIARVGICCSFTQRKKNTLRTHRGSSVKVTRRDSFFHLFDFCELVFPSSRHYYGISVDTSESYNANGILLFYSWREGD